MHWLERLYDLFSYRGRVDLLVDSSSIHRVALAERMRADRNGSHFSILLIRLSNGKSSSSNLQSMARLLKSRLRLTDSAGMWADGRIGVVLPDTSGTGAWKVAEDICETFPVGRDRPDCEVVVYPQHLQRDSDKSPKEKPARVPAQLGGDEGCDALLATRMPLWKRTIDVFGSACGLVAAAPLLILAGAAIKLSSPGPVFYSQTREGLGGRRFQIWKLRTMRPNADQEKDSLRPYSEQDGPAFKMMCDPRITRVGRFLRRFSLDEIPQLWNVLRGDMSLVGPRPLPVDESLDCEAWQRRRLLVTPGLTCIWQIEGRNVVPFVEWIRMDLHYVARRSMWYDLKLLLRTPLALLFSKGPR